MWGDKLLDLIFEQNYSKDWPEKAEQGWNALFGSPNGRYPANTKESKFQIRNPRAPENSDFAPFVAFINPQNPKSGAYGGMSVAIFPGVDRSALITFVVGTNGLAPDEVILGRPGHSRKVRAICDWLNAEFGKGKRVAWAKYDPTRTEQQLPKEVRGDFPKYNQTLEKYGSFIYGMFAAFDDRRSTLDGLTAFLDLMFDERGITPLGPHLSEAEQIQTQWFRYLMPRENEVSITQLLKERRYVLIEGPPGTGKTKLARDLISSRYKGEGTTIQFHANTTYENFIGGLAPESSNRDLGLSFKPKAGYLMEAAEKASKLSGGAKYLLHIDEINRADMAKVLGEAIYLLEADEKEPRTLNLPFDFEGIGKQFKLPENLHIIGTMNTADRSLAVIDVAIRRRFAFAKLWPQMEIVEKLGCDLTRQAFRMLLGIFVEHATDESLSLVPGHSYFLEADEERAKRRLRTTLVPLLEDYLAQGYVAPFSEEIRSYLQWLATACA
ncbi:MAG TPA: AAA family ATPase [Candidatus Binataceae bacterium]|nr:AAA family ATPase [Candidatus Binataceae bacterium]